MILIADICGVCGMSLFLFAEVKQIIKIFKTHKVTGISFSAYASKLLAILFTGIMFTITALYMSIVVITIQGVLVSWIAYLIKKDRRK
jgi:uncharacterized protein with PQ loop repeat